MWDPIYEQAITWAGLAVLLVLCLPFKRIQKLLLEMSAWSLRLALLSLLGAAAYLWFHPQNLPAEVANTLDTFPLLGRVLPAPGAQNFGICAAALLVIPLLPLLAILDVTRQLAGGRLRRLRTLAEVKAHEGAPSPHSAPAPAPAVRRVDRRSAADVLADAGSRKPFSAPNRPES